LKQIQTLIAELKESSGARKAEGVIIKELREVQKDYATRAAPRSSKASRRSSLKT